MPRRVWFLVSVIFIISVFLLVSCAPPVAQIISIVHNPDYPKEGEIVVFTINYKNASSTEPLNDAVLEVSYNKYLIYRSSKFEPTENSPGSYSLMWKLGNLQPGQAGTVTVEFEVASGIPIETYQLSLDARINGSTSQGSSSDNEQATSFLEGHPTPTPTSLPVVEEYQEEGVTVELPEQSSQKVIHSEKRDFEIDPMAISVVDGYSIIRPLIYLDIFDQDKEIVNDFSPAIILTVKYTANDIEDAGTADNLVVLVFDKEQSLWVPCDGKNNTEKTKCTISSITQFSEEKGYGTINISIDSWTSGVGVGKR